jgi:4-amino-4-deoxy-L-arabinose transferase-like glycosyltransferase
MRYLPLTGIILLVGALLLLAFHAPLAIAVLLTDGLWPLGLIAAAAGIGIWAVRRLDPGRGRALDFCLAAALGLGILAWLTLALGCAGLLGPRIARTLIGAGLLSGLIFLFASRAGPATSTAETARHEATGSPPPRELNFRFLRDFASLWSSPAWPAVAQSILTALVLIVPLAVLVYGATLPPGVLWFGEARGYDVLEYHLQCPREYFEAGRIQFLPHNAYASFPQQMEMLYLLLMHAIGDPHAAAVPAQLLHAFCAVLAVLLLAAWMGRPTAQGWGRGLILLMLAAAVPWLVYLGALAYVECGMLLFAAAAAYLLFARADRAPGTWVALAAGVCAGLAGGCKYTAIALVTAALPLSWALAGRAPAVQRMRTVLLFGLGAILALSPWLIRNAAFTGNPVYPFGYEVFGGRAWSGEQEVQWDRGHSLPSQDASAWGRAHLALRELVGRYDTRERTFEPSLFGPAIWLLALLGVIRDRSRTSWALVLWILLILAIWAGFTHMPGRFAVPAVVPLLLLAARPLPTGRLLRAGTVGLTLLAAVAGSVQLWRLLQRHETWWRERVGVGVRHLPGNTEFFVKSRLLNDAVPPDGYVWIVGDAAVFYVDRPLHYTVAFSRDPWLEFARNHAPGACVQWLRDRGVTHVWFAWPEIERLRQTYGFTEVVTRDWVRRLAEAGLERVPLEGDEGVGELYRVLP